ncbi:MAG: Type secretion system ATPase, PrtD, partial [Bradyrhizobium sp.]|nr:Type secretion system ATPase, PrtD [Bradyrhizobium sp.]
ELFDGSIAINIARFDPKATPAAVLAAARAAGAHELILSFPDGWVRDKGWQRGILEIWAMGI